MSKSKIALHKYYEGKSVESSEFQTLRSEYANLVQLLKQSTSQDAKKQFERTESEIRFEKKWKSMTDIQIFESVLIGKSQFDFFIPAIAGCPLKFRKSETKSFNAVIIEIDGSIHDKSFKSRKDNSHEVQVHNLSFITFRIDNFNINSQNTSNTIQDLIQTRKNDSRAKHRIWRSIYVESIASYQKESEFIETLRLDKLRYFKIKESISL